MIPRSGFRSGFAVLQCSNLFCQLLILCFQSSNLVIHCCELSDYIIGVQTFCRAAAANTEGNAYIEGSFLVSVESCCAAYGHHDIFIEMIETADSRCLGAVIITHCCCQLEFGTGSVIIEGMQAGQSCGDSAYIVDFTAEIGYTAV